MYYIISYVIYIVWNKINQQYKITLFRFKLICLIKYKNKKK